MSDFLTTADVGEILAQPDWRIRRAVDSLENIPRFGGRRAIPRDRLPEIIDVLRLRGWIQKPEPAIP